MGAKCPAAPLGMITLAALLPKGWDIKLIDMNASQLHDSDIDWADLVFIGGMLPQQVNFLKLIDRGHSLGKKVVVGGPDPTSQPGIYEKADYLVLGEAEDSIIPFLEALEKGVERGTFLPPMNKPDITRSPVPRFDLLNFKDYLKIGIQFSRGCPFNCEFCDIIELYGRKPRTKSADQILAELNALYQAGYRGPVEFVDDNFVGNRKRVKKILSAVREWSESRNYPFYFGTEASINLADDEELLRLMRDVDFRYVFVGIESADDVVLQSTQKGQNLNRNIYDDLHKFYQHGIIVSGGFIIGFDDETSETARMIVDTVNDGKICIAMVGLLYALPNTQLTRRLKREKRFFENSNQLDVNDTQIDQTTSGLNFFTKRPRKEIIEDFIYILRKIYSPNSYFDRCWKVARMLNVERKCKPSITRKLKNIPAFLRLVNRLGLKPPTCYYFWRNILITLFTNPSALVEVCNLMALFIHFRKQTNFVIRHMTAHQKSERVTEPVK
ncbi:MAG: B12-binding domain-containing radical SAM protein [Spirochaetota bacterium]